jgi:hypothetical protein
MLYVGFIITFMVLGTMLPAFAQSNDASPTINYQRQSNKFSKPYGSHLKPLLQRIQASPEQERRISMIVESYRSKIEPLRQSYKDKNQDFLKSVLSGMSPEIVMSKQIELGHLYCDISSQYCLLGLEVRRILNPEQIIKYEQYKREQDWK